MSWPRRLWNTLSPGRAEREIDRELAFHLSERIDDLRAQGLSDGEARRRARVMFGNPRVQAERTRQADVSMWIDGRLRDVRYAVRSLGRAPGFTLTVVLTLALGIGANTAVFSALDAVLLRPLPFPEGDRLVRLRQTQDRSAESGIAPVRLEDWHRLNATFDAITGYYTEDVSETSGDVPERVKRAFVAPRFLEVWGIGPAIGRDFVGSEHLGGGPPAVLVSDRYWRVRLGADPSVLRRSIRVGRTSFPIVGVLPPSFRVPDRAVDLWFPVAIDRKYAQSRLSTWYTGIGRLKRDVTLERARANLAAVQTQLAQQYPESDATLRVEIQPLKDVTVGSVRRSLWLVFGAVSVLLLITCTNVAALLLSRATHRRQEIAVRLSLGASGKTIAAQLLTETLLLSLAGAAGGLLLSNGAASAFRAAADFPRTEEIVLDGRVLAYTLVSTFLVALMCGVLPAFRASRDRGAGALGEGARTQVSTRNALQWCLVGAQVALSVTLLAGAGLLARSLHELDRVDPGFNQRHVLTFRISGDFSETANYERMAARIDGTIERLRALPGVEAVATTLFLPGTPVDFESAFTLVEARTDAERRMVAESRFVSPEYFGTMQIPVVGGAPCERLPMGVPGALMVNRSFANRYLSAWSSPVGLHLSTGSGAPLPGRIAGVVADARERGVDRAPAPTVYTCFGAPNPTPHFLVRTRGEPLALTPAVRSAIKELEPLRAVYDIAGLDARIGGAFAQNRLRTWLLAVFAATALALACVGVYGTLSYVVSLRRREVGLRLALGALRSRIVLQFLGQGLRVVGVAALAGLALAFAFTRVLEGMLYGVSASDPMVFAVVIGIVLAVAAIAALVPAARAARVEPMQVLRDI